MKKALLIGAALLGAVTFAGAQSLSVAKSQYKLTKPAQPREEVALQVCGELPEPEEVAGIGTNQKALMAAAAKFETEDLENYVGWEIKKIAFFPTQEQCKYNAMVWADDMTVLGEAGDQAPELGAINTHALKAGVKIEAGKTYFVGYRADTETGHPLGCDAGPAVDGYGDLISLSEDGVTLPMFISLHQAVPSLDYNFYIVAYVSNETGVEAVLTNDPANAYVQNGVINVTGANGRQVSLYNMNGQLVYSGVDTTIPAQKGMYVLRVGARSFKLAI